MSDSHESNDSKAAGFDAMSQMFTRMWSDFAGQMASQGLSGQPPGPDMAKQMRDHFFAAWSEACDRYMRSQEFQQMMRQSMQAAIDLRKQMNEQMGDFQHAMQGASRQDIDRLMESIDNLERRVNETFGQMLVDNLEALSQRLEALEQRVDSPARTRETARQATGKKAAKKNTKKTVKKSKSSRSKKSA